MIKHILPLALAFFTVSATTFAIEAGTNAKNPNPVQVDPRNAGGSENTATRDMSGRSLQNRATVDARNAGGSTVDNQNAAGATSGRTMDTTTGTTADTSVTTQSSDNRSDAAYGDADVRAGASTWGIIALIVVAALVAYFAFRSYRHRSPPTARI